MLRFGRLVILQRQGLEKSSSCACLHNGRSSNSSKKSKRREKSSSEEKITNREINLFDRLDHRTPLPGNIGLVPSIREDPQVVVNRKSITVREIGDDDYIIRYIKELISKSLPEKEDLPENKRLDITVNKCPQLIENDFQKLFPHNVFGRDLTLVTFNRREMLVEEESEEENTNIENEPTEKLLVQDFLKFADLICRRLKRAGYWADFVDPSVDWSQYQKPDNSMLIEVAFRYQQQGFTLEKNGKCQVISHHKLGTSLYVGSLLTNASHDSPQLLNILELFIKK